MGTSERELNQLTSSTESIRQTTRWAAAAYGATGAVLVAGLQLRDIDNGDNAFFAFLGLTIALIGIAVGIQAASRVLVAHFTTLGQINRLRVASILSREVGPRDLEIPLDHADDIVAEISRNWATLVDVGVADLSELEEALRATRLTYRSRQPSDADEGARSRQADGFRGSLRTSEARVILFANDVAARLMYRDFRRRSVVAGVLLVVGVLVFTSATAAGASESPDEPENTPATANPPATARPRSSIGFRWYVEERTADQDRDGLQDYEDPDSTIPLAYPVNFAAADEAACQDAVAVSWQVDGRDVAADKCTFTHDFPREGSYEVSLEVTDTRNTVARHAETVVVQNWLIVSVGDSVASGEGSPPWRDRVKCHRSAVAGPAAAARMIQAHDDQTSVTFLHVACTGATVAEGLLGSHSGRPPQLGQVRAAVGDREIDALLLSVGANDIGFGQIARKCAASLRHCQKLEKVRKDVAKIHTLLPGEYSRLDACLTENAGIEQHDCGSQSAASLVADPGRVYISEYFNPTRDETGVTCKRILLSFPVGIDRAELAWAEQNVIEPLNAAVAEASNLSGWTYIGSIFEAFRLHGYCARSSWIVKLTKALLNRNLQGPLHPNALGQALYGQRIYESLVEAFYSGGEDSPRPPAG